MKTDDEVLSTWDGLNSAIRGAGEETCLRLLKLELRGKARPTFVLRIHSRLNKIRADRERLELEAVVAREAAAKQFRWLR